MEFLNTHIVEIACAKKGCAGKFKATLGHLRNSPTLTCSQCGSKIEFKGKDIDKGLKDIQRSLQKFHRTLEKLSN